MIINVAINIDTVMSVFTLIGAIEISTTIFIITIIKLVITSDFIFYCSSFYTFCTVHLCILNVTQTATCVQFTLTLEMS